MKAACGQRAKRRSLTVQGPLFFEELAKKNGFRLVAGIDEAGRGCLAGPVVAAAVILKDGTLPEGVDDSKALTRYKRERAFRAIAQSAICLSVGVVGPRDIEDKNILNATIEAMVKAVKGLNPVPDFLLIDGPLKLPLDIPQQAIIKGDRRSASIASASVVAKVYRDWIMEAFATAYPEYGFERHKGYGTREHLAAIKVNGPCGIHRFSFKGVKDFKGYENNRAVGRRPCLKFPEETGL